MISLGHTVDLECIWILLVESFKVYNPAGHVVNFIIRKALLESKIKDGADLLNPLFYYLSKVGIQVIGSYTRPVCAVQCEG